MKRIILCLGSVILLACGGGGLSPGGGEPLSSLSEMPSGEEFVIAFDASTPISYVNLLDEPSVEESCSGGGSASTSNQGTTTAYQSKVAYNHCVVSLVLNGTPYEETLNGDTRVELNISGEAGSLTQRTKISLGGDLGLALDCDVEGTYANIIDENAPASGTCRVFDADGEEIEIPAGLAFSLI